MTITFDVLLKLWNFNQYYRDTSVNTQWEKSPKKQSEGVRFLLINTLLQTAFSAIFPLGMNQIVLVIKLILIIRTTGVICMLIYLPSLVMTQYSGNYWLQIIENYSVGIPLLVVALLEVISVSYLYGIER